MLHRRRGRQPAQRRHECALLGGGGAREQGVLLLVQLRLEAEVRVQHVQRVLLQRERVRRVTVTFSTGFAARITARIA